MYQFCDHIYPLKSESPEKSFKLGYVRNLLLPTILTIHITKVLDMKRR